MIVLFFMFGQVVVLLVVLFLMMIIMIMMVFVVVLLLLQDWSVLLVFWVCCVVIEMFDVLVFVKGEVVVGCCVSVVCDVWGWLIKVDLVLFLIVEGYVCWVMLCVIDCLMVE